MAYQQGTSTSQQDFLQKLFTFATANGWTQDEFDTVHLRGALHNGTCFVQFRWDGNAGGSIAMFQSLSFTAGLAPEAQPNNAGSKWPTTNPMLIFPGRGWYTVGNGPYINHWFFAYTSPTPTIYAVLEPTAGQYLHMGFGSIEKYGDWVGGEFSGGQYWNGTDGFTPSSGNNYVLFDGGSTQDDQAAVIHVENMPGQNAGKWAAINGQTATFDPANLDGSGIAKGRCMSGGIRGGMLAAAFGKFETSQLQGFVPLIPVPIFWRNRSVTPNRLYLIGWAPNMRSVNLAAFDPEAEVPLGSDTWKLFPIKRKASLTGNSSAISANGGIAYLKV